MSEEPAPKISGLLAALEANVLHDVVQWLNEAVENCWLDVDGIREHAVVVHWRDYEDERRLYVYIALDTGLVVRAEIGYDERGGEKYARYVEVKYFHMATLG
jgi:hypothetical protein